MTLSKLFRSCERFFFVSSFLRMRKTFIMHVHHDHDHLFCNLLSLFVFANCKTIYLHYSYPIAVSPYKPIADKKRSIHTYPPSFKAEISPSRILLSYSKLYYKYYLRQSSRNKYVCYPKRQPKGAHKGEPNIAFAVKIRRRHVLLLFQSWRKNS
jgi:hypothetical protein